MDWDQRIGRRIKLRDLHVLLAVAEHGSMAKAAGRLNISHPVVSKTITALEHAVGVPLFDRTARGVTMTDYGVALVKSGVAVFDEMRAGIRRIEHLADPNQGELRFGCPEAMAGGLMQEAIRRFLNSHPGVQLDIVTVDTVAGNFRELREREVEFLIGRIRKPFIDDELASEVLAHEGLVIAAGKQNPLHRRKRIALADLIDAPWLLPPEQSLPGAMARDFFRQQGLEPPRASIITLSLQLNLAFLGSGPHLCVLPSSMLLYGAARDTVAALPVDLPQPDSAIGVLTVRNRTLSPAAETFLSIARKTAAAIDIRRRTSARSVRK
jgi:DNA-binding transcriptional LysR family regulator